MSESSKEQHSSIDQINETIQDFNRTSQTLAKSSEEITESSEVVMKRAGELDKILRNSSLIAQYRSSPCGIINQRHDAGEQALDPACWPAPKACYFDR